MIPVYGTSLAAAMLMILATCGLAAEPISRLIIYDVRGRDADETVLIIEKKTTGARVWLKNYIGEREGGLPIEVYDKAFADLKVIKRFAQLAKYRGQPLRSHAAKGSVTLAWQENNEKQIQTIRYYAPENTLPDFRAAFNQAWALARYAILSLSSLESPKRVYREDAIYFLSGNGWLTEAEIQEAVRFYIQKGFGRRYAGGIWGSINLTYPQASEFSKPTFLYYCVQKGIRRLGADGRDFLLSLPTPDQPAQKKLREAILKEFQNRL
jgi:hypothetical protein